MADFATNSESQLELPAAPEQSQATTLAVVPPITPAPEAKLVTKAKRLRFWERFKKIAWRCTAGYLWLRVIIDSLFSGAPLRSTELFTVQHWTAYLSSVGFAPGNPGYMLPLLKAGWLLAITELNLWQLFGFGIYLLSYPITMIFMLWYSDVIHEQVQNTTRPGLLRAQSPSVVLLGSAVLMAAWYLLYGDATSPRPLAAGIAFASILFLSLVFRAFQRARPLSEDEVGFASGLDRVLGSGITDKTRLSPKTRLEATSALKWERLAKGMLVYFEYFFRGKRGRDRVTMYILLEYVVFLVLLAFSGVLFWSLAIKLAAGASLSLRQAVLLSTSHFLPGVHGTDLPPNVPLWTQVGPALTSWILFVLFVGPAASLLPSRQAMYAKRIETRCRLFRKYIAAYQVRIRVITRAKAMLPN